MVVQFYKENSINIIFCTVVLFVVQLYKEDSINIIYCTVVQEEFGKYYLLYSCTRRNWQILFTVQLYKENSVDIICCTAIQGELDKYYFLYRVHGEFSKYHMLYICTRRILKYYSLYSVHYTCYYSYGLFCNSSFSTLFLAEISLMIMSCCSNIFLSIWLSRQRWTYEQDTMRQDKTN